MSTKLYNIDSSTFIPASDFRSQQNEESLWTGSQSYSVSRDAFDYFTGAQQLLVGTPATVLDPSLPTFWSFMLVRSVEVEHVVGGFAKVRANFSGYYSFNQNADPGSENPTTYALQGVLEETPLMEHPKVAQLTDIERQYIGYLVEGLAVWDIDTSKLGALTGDTGEFVVWPEAAQKITTADGIAFADLLAQGDTTYKRATYTWTENYESTTEFPASKLNDLGKIDVPDGDPPEADGGRDWMLISIGQTQTASTEPVYSAQRTWLLSERGGWNETLYQ